MERCFSRGKMASNVLSSLELFSQNKGFVSILSSYKNGDAVVEIKEKVKC